MGCNRLSELMELRLFNPDGTPIRSLRISGELDRWNKLRTREPRSWFDSADGPVRIVDAESGGELYIRHSRVRARHMAIRLKEVGKWRVLKTLAEYNQSSRKSLERAVLEADLRLAEMANLGPPTFREDGDTRRTEGTQSPKVAEKEGQVTVLRGSFDTTLPVRLDSLIKMASQRMERYFEQETEDHNQLRRKVRQVSSDLQSKIAVLNENPDPDNLLDVWLFEDALLSLRNQDDSSAWETGSVAEWILFAYGLGGKIAARGVATVDQLVKNRTFVRAHAGFNLACGATRFGAAYICGRGLELSYGVIQFGRLFGRPQPSPDSWLVVSAALDLFARGFHESVPLPQDGIEIALGGARHGLWLGVLNRGLQPPQGQLARLLAEHPELQEWGKGPYVS
jgi:hypothetical protein